MLTTKLVLLLGAALTVPTAPPVHPTAPHPHPMTLAQGWHAPPPPAGGRYGYAPPPPPIEVVRPRRGYVWVEGGFEWRHGRYVRLPGHWERERHGHHWRAGRWEPQGDRHVWIRGAWIDTPAITVGVGMPVVPPQPVAPPPPLPPPPPHYARLSISGQIFDQYRRPVPGVMVVLAGTSEGRAVTDGYGRYIFAGLVPGSYAVRPNDPRCGFGPDVMNLNNLGTNAVQNFNANCR